ncbi:putative enzyme related to lactoylglutathione lyase [Labrenzia sp. EL_13]|uniref:VOC family protein n=1 Tax=Roseibium album TaxID=311410 RepID=UPI0018C8F6E8|nr:putative enzyme related to lactoylglutathione lyase [Labrenzia sp. EL_195]MBG6204529.1 putative enzyme related to lactoylglutathione lyase [Labrenzia sp. EL_13]
MQRGFTNILAVDVAQTAAFYETLLGLKPKFSSDWFVNLADPGNPDLELGILQRTNEIVPASARQAPAGVILTFVVDDCDTIHQRAIASNADIVEAPTDMPYGQRRMIVRDPAGTFIDISSLV